MRRARAGAPARPPKHTVALQLPGCTHHTVHQNRLVAITPSSAHRAGILSTVNAHRAGILSTVNAHRAGILSTVNAHRAGMLSTVNASIQHLIEPCKHPALLQHAAAALTGTPGLCM